MLATKEILIKITNSRKGKELTTEELQRLQKHLIKMYRDIEEVCNRHGLNVCLAYGNVIGAIRHQGWIPWDDDLDLHMSREDYDKFLKIYSKELPPQYKVSSYLTEGGSWARFAKVIDTSTVHVEIGEEKNEYSGVYVDIFPIDNLPDQPIRNKLRRLIAMFMMYTATSVQQVELQSKAYKELMYTDKAGRANWRIRQLWGTIFFPISSKTWHRWIEKFGSNKRECDRCHVVASSKNCFKPNPKDMYFPFREVVLPELGTVKIPNDLESYLGYWYGDWRTIPENQDKWHHYVTELYIP